MYRSITDWIEEDRTRALSFLQVLNLLKENYICVLQKDATLRSGVNRYEMLVNTRSKEAPMSINLLLGCWRADLVAHVGSRPSFFS